jgi:hypothetical protein
MQVRERTKIVLERAKRNELKHFDVDLEKVRTPMASPGGIRPSMLTSY